MKKILSFLMAAAMLTSTVISVSAEYAVSHETGYTGIVGSSQTTDHDAHVFKVGNRKFLMLDKDADGNYFVMADENYGSHWFVNNSTDIWTNPELTDDEWNFNPENEKSIAHWLNNDFIQEGNGGAKLPDDILNNIIEDSEWEIEPAPVTKLSTNDYNKLSAEAKADYDEWLTMQHDGKRTVTADLALVSVSEFAAYNTIIRQPSGDWKGILTRTIHTDAQYNGDGGVTYKRRAHHLRGSGSANDNYTTHASFDADLGVSYAWWVYTVRPVFWLDKDFFKNVKIDITATGTAVKEELKAIGYTDLSETYDNNELSLIGFNARNMPIASNAYITGAKTAGGLLDVKYTYSGKKTEDGTYFEKYVSDTENGTYALKSKGTTLDLSTETNGQYVKIAVVPKDNTGNTGKRVWIAPFCLEDIGTAVNESSINPSAGSATVKLADTTTACIITLAQYDANGEMINSYVVDTTDSEETDFDLTLQDFTAGGKIAIIVEHKDGSKPIYYRSL